VFQCVAVKVVDGPSVPCVAVCGSMLQCAAQYVAVCFSVLQEK